jgi:hypothetical protein
VYAIVHVLFPKASDIRPRDDEVEVARDGRLVADAADRGADPVAEDALVERLGGGGWAAGDGGTDAN